MDFIFQCARKFERIRGEKDHTFETEHLIVLQRAFNLDQIFGKNDCDGTLVERRTCGLKELIKRGIEQV